MREPAIVLGATGLQILDQMSARVGIEVHQVFIRKGAQQQFRLIQSAGVRRRIERPQARMASQVGFGGVSDMWRAVIQDQM
jgi:hypothetical protein